MVLCKNKRRRQEIKRAADGSSVFTSRGETFELGEKDAEQRGKEMSEN